jgi:hypothetical protein
VLSGPYALALLCSAAQSEKSSPQSADAEYALAREISPYDVELAFYHFAGASHVNQEVLAYLKRKNIRMDVSPSGNAWNALDAQIANGDLENVRKLLALGMKVNAPEPEVDPPLSALIQVAQSGVSRNTVEMAKLLIAHGADPYARGRNGFSPLSYASDPAAPSAVKALLPIFQRAGRPLGSHALRHVVPTMGPNCNGLCNFLPRHNVAMLRDALKETPEAVQVPDGYYRPLNLAVQYYSDAPADYAEIIRLMIAAGADPNQKDPDGMNAFDLLNGMDPATRKAIEPLLHKSKR